jgi:DNA polymerase-3 subunit delta
VNLLELVRELETGRVRPAYLLAGEEALLRDDAIDALRSCVLAGAADDFNFDRLPGESTTPAALADALGSLPVMAERRLVLLVEPEGRRGGSKLLVEAIAEQLPALLERAETVFVVAASKPDKRSRWVKAFGAEPAGIVEGRSEAAGSCVCVGCGAATRRARRSAAPTSAARDREGAVVRGSG